MFKVTAFGAGVGVTIWIGYLALVANPVVLFSWHPVCFCLAYLVATPSAILAMSDRRRESNFNKRTALLDWHVYMQSLTIVLMSIGFGVIYYNKDLHNRPHFQTTHSYVGVAAFICYFINYLGGMLKRDSKNPKDAAHRYFGALSFLLSGTGIVLGFYSGGWGKTNLGPSGQLGASVLVVIAHIATVAYMFSPKKPSKEE
ncbi:hypothetical protein THRCLA_01741 [Thraustotheca clavata]|uniref:Cytochrome b561 domain-containing protein n=1 Tax=Thraustotheca clavata TaxID=74557 RepID=A0A1W0A7L3_9STRA|nr:hypothetical protein THRCLA_01741 [Thraustotheca clavata]